MKILRYFHPLAPCYLAAGAKHHKYDPDRFLDWYLKTDNLSQYFTSWKALQRPGKLLALWGFYFWLFFAIAGAVVVTLNPLIGLAAVALSPFATSGSMYALMYIIRLLKTSPKKASKNTHKTG
jgi:hypothetical protein